MPSEVLPADCENREMPLVFLTGRIMTCLYVGNKKIRGYFVEAYSFNKDGSLTEYYIRESDYRLFESQMDSRRTSKHESECRRCRSAISQQLVNKAVYKIIYYPPGRKTVHWGKVFNILFYIICIAVATNVNLIRDTNHDDGDTMTKDFEMIYNILYLSYSCTTSLFGEILFLVHSMLQSSFHFVLLTITASLTFVDDNFPFKLTGFIIFILTCLGYLPMVYWIKKLLGTNAHLKQVEEKMTFEKKTNCSNLNEIEKLKLKLKENENLILTIRDNSLNLNLQKKKLKLELKEKGQSNSKLELQNKDLQFRAAKKTKKNDVLKSENVKLNLKFKEAKKLNVMLESTGSQLESQNEKFKSELEKVKSQHQECKLELEREKDQRLCNVCTEKYKDILLLPCNHFSLCKTCFDKLNLNKTLKCPICRKGIEKTIDVYTS